MPSAQEVSNNATADTDEALWRAAAITFAFEYFDSIATGGDVTALPKPETYAMLLAGLGLLGFAARRRKQPTA